MIHNNSIKLCSLSDYDSIRDWLIELGYSKSQLNKRLEKKFLSRPVKSQDEFEFPLNVINMGMVSPSYVGEEAKVIYEDAHFVAIHKPHNVDGHSLHYSDHSCLSSLRQMGRVDLLKVNSSEYERGMLYRLDKVTSGILVFAKNDEVFQKVRNNFKSIAREKLYWAIVPGKISLQGEFVHFFTSSGAKGSKMLVHDNEQEGAKQGALEIVASDYREESDTTRLTVKLKTGLRHQIRAQLAHMGYPILGDEFYGGKTATRVYLHAYLYKFEFGNDTIEFVDGDFTL